MRRKNYGIDILRSILTFSVICCHFWKPENISGIGRVLDFGRNIAVPCFFVLSFMYGGKYICSGTKRFFGRLLRFYVPLAFWSTVYCLFMGTKNFVLTGEGGITIIDILIQFSLGSSMGINSTLWYLGNTLIIIIIMFCVYHGIGFVRFLVRKNDSEPIKCIQELFSICIMVALSGFCYYMQYSGIYYSYISDWELGMIQGIGRLVESIPYATAGYAIGIIIERNIARTVSSNKKLYWIMPVGAVIIMLYAYISPFTDPGGFGYAGIDKLFISITVIMLFYLIPLNLTQSENDVCENRFFMGIARYSMGIYCIHIMIGIIIEAVIKLFIGEELFIIPVCMLIYLVSYLICDIINRCRFRWISQMIN